MKLSDFIENCVSAGCVWAEGEHNGKKGFFIKSERFNTKAHITNEAIEQNEWPKLNRAITQGKDVYNVTRVVGYYSRVQNWNKSKVAELADRQRGSYAI